jgi:hypothetical protein
MIQSEILNSPPLTLIPKNILKAPAHDPTDQKASPAYAALPNPSAAHPLRRPDQRFLDSEAFTDKFASHMGGPMEKVSRRLMRRWMDFSQDHAELGAALNGFSLNETSPLAGAIEKTGQAVDATYLSTTMLVRRSSPCLACPSADVSRSCKTSSRSGRSRCTSTRSSRRSSRSCSRTGTRSTCSSR